MKYIIHHQESYPLIECILGPDEKIIATLDAMVAMSPSVNVRGTFSSGYLKEFIARGIGRVLLAPVKQCSIKSITMRGRRGFLVHEDDFVACTAEIRVDRKIDRSLNEILSHMHRSMIRLDGQGTAFVSGWGAIHSITLGEKQECYLDIERVAAWTDDIHCAVEKLRSSFFSLSQAREVFRFQGPGTVLMHTRRPLVTRIDGQVTEESSWESAGGEFDGYEQAARSLMQEKNALAVGTYGYVEKIAVYTLRIVESMIRSNDVAERITGKRFLDKYLPATQRIIDEHKKLSSLGLSPGDAKDSLSRSNAMLERLAKAFEDRFVSLQQKVADNFTAEMNALDAMLKMQGD